MFNMDSLLADCRAALVETDVKAATVALVERAVAAPGDLERAFGPLVKGGVQVLHHADDLTVLHIVWPPGIRIFPHDHRMWAVIGIYAGIEDNTFYRRDPAAGLSEVGTVRLEPRHARALGADAVHSVANPAVAPTAALHVYGGDFFAAERSQFDTETYAERRYDQAEANRVFAEADARWRAAR